MVRICGLLVDFDGCRNVDLGVSKMKRLVSSGADVEDEFGERYQDAQ